MDIQVPGIQPLFTVLKAMGFQVVEIRDPDTTPPHGSASHPGGENVLQSSIEVFESIANGSSRASAIPPNSAHIQVRGNCLQGSHRSLMSPWLEVEGVQKWVRANQ